MARRYDTVTFLSDYGRADEFVGVVHSVIRSLAPHVTVVDLTHDIAPYDTRGAGLLLARAAQYLSPGVVVAVVDPGVGTARRGVAVEVGDGASVLIGPDNGLLAPAVAMCGGADRAVELANPDYQLPAPGPTFAGRDVFAPAAAHLCAGVALEHLGPVIDPAGLLPGILPVSRVEGGVLEAEVLWVDRYGNAQLNVDPGELDEVFGAGEPVELVWAEGSRVAHRVQAFAEVEVGRVGVVTDSYGLAAVVLDRGSAAGELGLHAGTAVTLRPLPDGGGSSAPSAVTTSVHLSARSSRGGSA
jgi:S-adenosylmethionine hydrolase